MDRYLTQKRGVKRSNDKIEHNNKDTTPRPTKKRRTTIVTPSVNSVSTNSISTTSTSSSTSLTPFVNRINVNVNNNKNKNNNNKSKHNGRHKIGTYNKDNPHKESWAVKCNLEQKQLQNRLKWWVVSDDKGHCTKCRRAQKNISFAKGISIYSSSSATRKLNAHDKEPKHNESVTFCKSIDNPDDNSRIDNLNNRNNENNKLKKEIEFIRMMKPLIAIAFFVANSRIAIRKYKDIQKGLLPTIIHEMILIFKETYDEKIVKQMKQMALKYQAAIFELETETNGKIKNKTAIQLLKTFLNDIENSYTEVRTMLQDMDDPLVSQYLKCQTDFTELLSCIATVRRHILIKQIRESPVQGMEADESTDKSVRSVIIIYIHYIVAARKVIDFLGVFLLEGSTAADIVAAIVDVYDEMKLPKNRLIGGCFDNCNTMMGEKKSVKKLMLKHFVNFKLVQGDSDHNITIASKNSVKPQYNTMTSEIKSNLTHTTKISNYVRKSHKARRILKMINLLAIVYARHRFRWKGQSRHQKSICDSYSALRFAIPAVAPTTQKKTKTKLIKANHHLKQYKNAKLLHTETDINLLVTEMILAYESKDLQFDDFEGFLKKYKLKLQALSESAGKYENKFNEMITEIDEQKTIEIQLMYEKQLKTLKENLKANNKNRNNNNNNNIVRRRRPSNAKPTSKPPVNNYSITESTLWTCCDGLFKDSNKYIRCKSNENHFEHIECIANVNECKQNADYMCALCKRLEIIEHDIQRESDCNYEFSSDDDEPIYTTHVRRRMEEEKKEEEKNIKTNVVITGTNLIIYNKCDKYDEEVEAIKQNHILILIEQLNAKLVLAQTIALFKFLSPGYCVEIIMELDPQYDHTKYSLRSPKSDIISYFDEIKYGEKYVILIQKMFPTLLNEVEVMTQFKTNRHELFYAHLSEIGYRDFWYKYTSNKAWTNVNADCNIMVLMLVVLCLSSTNCERGFSLYNMICYWLTNRMSTDIVNDIMMIKNAKWSVEYVVNNLSNEITDEFKKIKNRRGPRNNYVKRKKKKKDKQNDSNK